MLWHRDECEKKVRSWKCQGNHHFRSCKIKNNWRMCNTSTIWVACNKWCKMYMWNWTLDCHGKSSIQQDDSSYQQTGLKFKEKLVKRYIWSTVVCWNMATSERTSEIPGKFWKVVEKDGVDQFTTDHVRNKYYYTESRRKGMSYIQ
jgi:hypothetical protein